MAEICSKYIYIHNDDNIHAKECLYLCNLCEHFKTVKRMQLCNNFIEHCKFNLLDVYYL